MSLTKDTEDDGGRLLATVVYVLYLLGFAAGITAIAGVLVAHFKISDANELYRSHFRYQIRTFWIGLLYFGIGIITYVILIGYLILFLAGLWYLIRCIKGLVRLTSFKPIEEPMTWLW